MTGFCDEAGNQDANQQGSPERVQGGIFPHVTHDCLLRADDVAPAGIDLFPHAALEIGGASADLYFGFPEAAIDQVRDAIEFVS